MVGADLAAAAVGVRHTAVRSRRVVAAVAVAGGALIVLRTRVAEGSAVGANAGHPLTLCVLVQTCADQRGALIVVRTDVAQLTVPVRHAAVSPRSVVAAVAVA